MDKLVKKRGLKGFTGNTITTPTQLKEQLRLVVERGYAVDNEEFEEGLRCIGAPVRDSSGKVVAAVSIAGPAFRLSEDKVVSLARVVVGVTDKLSSELGYQKPALVEPSSNLSEYAKAVA